ncbi:prickle-like protein 4 isoform X1 [Cavia porcellus]|uniref:prickle-like protein 4 isoform X1 n=1 Tax=Cavia porcellus TaxID=10141 RepID=UPI0003513EF3|nr:prickle-like protein 4 isoform X1 [Cavia porcellus]XP_013012368.1 prickle-like protein 4 isoform X1 [Cavia porcellus]XP_013012369.1 prickle-like protein 4 isoform X1 [Cavia porcellus]XP_013012371.1 prickle-like protein 4 isoform X1 [Cavia porcellus]
MLFSPMFLHLHRAAKSFRILQPTFLPCLWDCLCHSGSLFLQERYYLALGEEELVELRLFCAQRKQKALGQGVAHLVPPELKGDTCEKCRQQLKPGEVGVFATPEGKQRCWHPHCFACQACSQVLMHLIYFYHDGHLYCGRHHAELLRPRCPACDQLIFSQRYTEAEGRHWHENHFCCQDCSGPLSGGRYALTGGSPCCPRCFKSRYPDTGSSPQRAPEGWASPGAPGPDRSRGSAQALGRAVAQVPRSSPDILRGRVRPNASRDPEERTPCPTCSSSSDSEPEGFFLGRRLLRPRKIPEDSAASEKRCSVC